MSPLEMSSFTAALQLQHQELGSGTTAPKWKKIDVKAQRTLV